MIFLEYYIKKCFENKIKLKKWYYFCSVAGKCICDKKELSLYTEFYLFIYSLNLFIMSAQPASEQPLNEVQVMLLRLFSRPMPAQDLEAIREMLLTYYETALHQEVERVIEKKGITRTDFDNILNRQQRTK